MIKIALCLASTNKTESLSILQPLLQCNDFDIRYYAEKEFKIISEDRMFAENEFRINKVIELNTINYSSNFEFKIFI